MRPAPEARQNLARDPNLDFAALLSGAIENSPAWVSIVDPQMRLIAFNSLYAEGIEKHFGARLEPGMRLPSTLSRFPAWQSKILQPIERLFGGKETTVECEFNDRNGKKVVYEVRHRPLRDAAGRIIAGLCLFREVTAARALAAANRQLEAVFNDSPVGLAIIDSELRYVRINPKLADLNGLPVAAHLGRPLRDVLPQLANLTEPMLRQVLAQGKPVLNLELSGEVPKYPGALRAFNVNWIPLRDDQGKVVGINTITTDVTEQRQAEEALRESERKYRELIEDLYEGIWQIDGNSRTSFVNARMAEMLGARPEEIIGKPLFDFMEPSFVELATRNLEQGKRGIKADYEFVFRQKNGASIHTRIATTPLFDNDGIYKGALAAVVDLTEIKKTEDQLRRAIRTREDTLAIVSHDLKHPLSAIQMSSDLVVRLAKMPDKAEQLIRSGENIRRQVVRMQRMIQDLLDAAKIQEGRLPVEMKETGASWVLDEALGVVEPIAVERDISIKRVVPIRDFKLNCDPERICQVLSNLVGNAIKFSEPGSQVVVSVGEHEDSTAFSVQDEGPGIPPEQIPHLFERYWQSPDGKAQKGSGLGLYIAQGIVAAHEGRIWVESALGKGSTFYFTIPKSLRKIHSPPTRAESA